MITHRDAAPSLLPLGGLEFVRNASASEKGSSPREPAPSLAMPHKDGADEHGMKGARRKKSDKSRRTFELHGDHSQRHVRLREEQLARSSDARKVERTARGKAR